MIFLKIKDSFEISVGTWVDPSHTNGKNNLILKPQHVLLWKKQNYKKTNSTGIYGRKYDKRNSDRRNTSASLKLINPMKHFRPLLI